DVVLLDIRMPGMDGIETAHHLNAMSEPPAVVFATAYDEYAIDAFDARAVGYVLKPVRRERLERALQHAQRLAASTLSELSGDTRMATRRNHVCARVKGELRLIPLDQITCFVADQKYTNVHHRGGQNLIDDSLKSLEEEFTGDFVRIHRGALVKVSEIDRLEKRADGKTRLVLRGGSKDAADTLIISRRHVADVKRRLTGG
ncbi:MAG TPA: LytTR family DNA-binding domain-containing protein, partial [Gammaproteobacteria bacterium]|nr:LytTR family DNA-binding domain-containing protein [Gammaproteobacteria bacterium]